MNCPECNSKLRKFKDGVICIKNHKFLEGTEIYNKFYGINTYTNTHIDDSSKLYCSKCKKSGYAFCMCGNCGLKCKNGHIWDPDVYASKSDSSL
jgi:hypothetical protein